MYLKATTMVFHWHIASMSPPSIENELPRKLSSTNGGLEPGLLLQGGPSPALVVEDHD
jgi:hypothetical protein